MSSYPIEPPLQPPSPTRDGKVSSYPTASATGGDVEKSSGFNAKDEFSHPISDREHHAKHEKQRQDEKSTPAVVVDVFAAQEGGDGPDYRALGWKAAAVLLIKSQIGLGVLSIPSSFNNLGIVPGLLVVNFFGIVCTYGAYVLGQIRIKYPGVHSCGDVGFIIFGAVGREFFGWGYWLYQVFSAASGMLAASIAFNAITEHATCTVAWTAIAAVLVGIAASQRTFKRVSIFGWIGIFCIVPAILIVTIAVGIADRPPAAPPGAYDKKLKAFGNPTFASGMASVVSLLFAFGGTPGFFSIAAEMKNPLEYNKAMFCCQGFSLALYNSVSIVLWYYAGQYVTSPALGSAGPLIKKIAYGIAIPGLLAGPIIYTHLAVKFCFVRALRGTHHLQNSTKIHWMVWLGLVFGMTSFAFIIAEVIPFFDDLIGLIGALFASQFCIGIYGLFWIFDNDWKRKQGKTSLRYKFLYSNATMMITVMFFLIVAGFYAEVVTIRNSYKAGTVGSPFSCADNSG